MIRAGSKQSRMALRHLTPLNAPEAPPTAPPPAADPAPLRLEAAGIALLVLAAAVLLVRTCVAAYLRAP